MAPKGILKIERVEEFLLKKGQSLKIQNLLADCFDDYPVDATFYKQLPSFRYLAFVEKKLVGHLGVHYRMINNGGQLCKALCISDVCVIEAYRDQKIASKMMRQMEKDATKKAVDFLILIANESKLYFHLGYRGRSNTFRWLMIQQQESFGIIKRSLGKEVVMVKKISDKKWSKDMTDLLGPIF